MKKIMSFILSIILIITIIPFGIFDLNVMAATYPTDYKKWSQGASSYDKMNGYGCWVVAQAKLIYECNIDRSSSFNPDTYMIWEQNNGYLNSNFYQVNGVNAPVAYAKSRGKVLNYLGCTSSSVETKIWDNISKGYKSIVYVTTSGGYSHYIMIANDLSSANGKLYCYDSWSGYSSVSPQSIASRNYRSINEVYSYSSNNSSIGTHTHNHTIYEYEATHPHKYYKKCSCGDYYYTGETAKVSTCLECEDVTIKNTGVENVTSSNAFVKGVVYKAKSAKVEKVGIKIRKEENTYTQEWKFHQPPASSTHTDTNEIILTWDLTAECGYVLRHATKYYYKLYARIDGVDYFSEEASFTTTGSHSYDSWTTTTASTCTVAGTQTRTCSCGKKETQSIAAKGHEYKSTFTVDKEASCAEAGSKSRHCIRCSAKTEITEIAKLEHTYTSNYDDSCDKCGELRALVFTYRFYDWTFDFDNATKLMSEVLISGGSFGEVMKALDKGLIESKEVLSTDTLTLPDIPERDGYIFTAWKILVRPGETVQDVTYNMYILQAEYEALPYVSGDLNNDGKINGRDYGMLMQYLNGWDVTINVDAADVNSDGKINGRDYGMLMQYLNGWDVELK
ncbi:MAG: hypothetical protein IJN56_06165 [Clostridia bacterium]|nr:hypothetical protein [Clostridia bacterium]